MNLKVLKFNISSLLVIVAIFDIVFILKLASEPLMNILKDVAKLEKTFELNVRNMLTVNIYLVTQLSESPTGAPLETKIDRVEAKAVLSRKMQLLLEVQHFISSC